MKIKTDRIVSEVSASTGYSKAIVDGVIKEFITSIIHEVSNGNSVKLNRLGVFEPTLRAARTGRNPHTNEQVPIPARVLPVFSPCEGFKNIVINSGKRR